MLDKCLVNNLLLIIVIDTIMLPMLILEELCILADQDLKMHNYENY